jgi:EmrB/QacA subfamily drug resistance transporter
VSITSKPPCDDGVIRSAPNSKAPQRHLEPWILATTILGSSMAFIDGTVVNVALPVLQRQLHATSGDVQWIVEAYSLFLSALILVGGSLGDHFGRKRIFGLGVFLFAASSMWCGFAPDVPQLILARSIQGIGGALLVPGSLAIISASFSPDKRGRAIGTWSGFTSITSAIGPVLGGWLVQYASWRWVFFINVPLAVIVLVLLFWRVPESRDEAVAKRLDWPGVFLATLGLGAIVYGLIQAGQSSLGAPIVLAALAVGIAALALFVVVEARSQAPMLPPSLFRSRTFSGANLLTLFLYAALGGALFFFPFNLIQVQGYDPTAAGAALLPFILLMFTLSRWSGGLVARYGAKLPLVIGPIIVAVGFALFAVPGLGSGQGNYWTTYFPAVVVLGLGMAISVAPLTTAVMGAVDSQRAGIASGVNNAVSRTAGLLAIAVLGIVMLGIFSSSLDNRLSSLNITSGVHQQIDAQKVKLGAISIPSTVSHGEAVSLERAIDEAFVDGFRIVMLCASGLALASSLSAAFLIEGKKVEEKMRTGKRKAPNTVIKENGNRKAS